jgi:glc operon protein GlcG
MLTMTIRVAALAFAATAASAAQAPQKNTLTLALAKKVAAAAIAEAERLHTTGAIAVVDDGGNLLYAERIDGTFPAGANISIGKARTAAMFRKPTRVFEDVINKGRTAMAALPDFWPLQGGVPLEIDGQVVGGIGVSGAASAQQDEELALAGAGALQGAATGSAETVTYFEKAAVAAAFARGVPLIESGAFKVHASRREKAGLAEVHTDETDIIYVTEGTATFVTGGTVVDGKEVAPGETRGASIRGGETRRLTKGDVIIVPAGVPHWFQAVEGTFTYYVVKVL